MQPRVLAIGTCLVGLLASAATAMPQGGFVNYETPQTHPIELFTFEGNEYVAVVNTPNNTLEVYEAAGTMPSVETVPVGLGPSSVRWNRGLKKLYVTNYDGDSVSLIGVSVDGSSIALLLEQTSSADPATAGFVADEPSDIAFGRLLVGGQLQSRALITSSSSSSVQYLDPLTLAPYAAPLPLLIPGSPNQVVHTPRYIEWLGDGRQYVANLSNSMRPIHIDDQDLVYDVAISQVDTVSSSIQAIQGLGTTIHAMAVDSSRDLLFVVGTRAKNQDGVGEAAVAGMQTGFVQSWLWVVDISGATPSPHDEANAGSLGPYPALPSINLNRDYTSNSPTPVEIPTSQALSQPTGIALIEDEGEVTRILITGFHSDRIAVLEPNSSIVRGYTFSYLDVPLDTSTDYSTVGPRGIVYSSTLGRAFANGRLDNSLIAFNPLNPTTSDPAYLKQQILPDPTPQTIRKGREFLYSARFSIHDDGVNPISGGFVSCASCHVDGRTDGLAWNLGGGLPAPPESEADPLNELLLDPTPGLFMPGNWASWFPPPAGYVAPYAYPLDKGPIVTQTLQGLVNYELNTEFQHVATNAPYYWRGARGEFTDFNKAFVNLQGMADHPESGVNGISAAEMEDFLAFVNTIRHPPNPEQPIDRRPSGNLDEDFPNEPSLATGAMKGMQQFHNTAQQLGGTVGSGPETFFRSCVDCHSLPDGSSNTLTMPFSINETLTGTGAKIHPMESAALRNIAPRERIKHNNAQTNYGPWTPAFDFVKSYEGLFHSGSPEPDVVGFPNESAWSINNFVHDNPTFSPLDPAGTNSESEVTEFIRQFDSGTAPVAGVSFTIDPNQTAFTNWAVNFLEAQVREGNIGLAAITRDNGQMAGYWFDITDPNPSALGVYTPEVGATTALSSTQLIAIANGPPSDNLVILQATPLGADRQLASLGMGASTIDQGPPPRNVKLQPMAPNVAYEEVANFDGNLHYTYSPPATPLISPTTIPTSVWTLRVMQHEVATSADPDHFGVDSVHHEPPRRFRVTGDNLRAGARLILYMAQGAPQSNAQPTLDMELYPTGYQADGKRIWETYVELDATQTFALLCGGYDASGVQKVLDRDYSTATFTADALNDLNADQWNWFKIRVVNEGGTVSNAVSDWMRLTVQDHHGNP